MKNILRPLKYVFAAIEHGSMRRVAQVVGVQESTVSRNIAAIEQYLDVQIFERRNDGVRLTQEGEQWLGTVRTHIDGLEESLIQTAHRNRDAYTLRIGLCSPVGQEFLLRLIDRFRKRHPKVDVVIRDGSCGKQVVAVRRRQLDVAFLCDCCDTRACCCETIWEEDFSVLLPANHRLVTQESVTWEDLAGEHLLVPMGVDGPQLDPYLRRRITAGISAPIIKQCHASQATVLVKVQLDEGFMLAGAQFAKGIVIQNTVWRSVIGANSSSPINAVWLESNPKRAALRLIAIAKNMAKELKQ